MSVGELVDPDRAGDAERLLEPPLHDPEEVVGVRLAVPQDADRLAAYVELPAGASGLRRRDESGGVDHLHPRLLSIQVRIIIINLHRAGQARRSPGPLRRSYRRGTASTGPPVRWRGRDRSPLAGARPSASPRGRRAASPAR